MKYFTCIAFMLWFLTVVSPYVVPKKGGGGGFNGRQNHDRGWAHETYENESPDAAKEELNCHDYFELQTDTIVRTKDSLKAGAKFISAPNVNTADECLEQCICDTGLQNSDYCDMAVFEEKNKNCYIFNCIVNKVNKCLFAHHEGYFSMVYDSESFTKADQAEERADDLADLLEDDDEDDDDGVHENVQPVPPEPTEPGIVHIPTTITTTTTATTTFKATTTKPPNYSNTWYYYTMGNGGNYDDNYKYEYKSYDDEYEKHKEGDEKEAPRTQEPEEPEEHDNKDQDGEKTAVPSSESTTPKVAIAQTDRTSNKVKENNPTTQATAAVVNGNTDSAEQTTQTVQQQTQNMNIEVDVEEISGRTTPETSVILPLAIGLAITLVLLIMVACRLRMVKRKLRHGRPLANSQEADYLINGMYL